MRGLALGVLSEVGAPHESSMVLMLCGQWAGLATGTQRLWQPTVGSVSCKKPGSSCSLQVRLVIVDSEPGMVLAL